VSYKTVYSRKYSGIEVKLNGKVNLTICKRRLKGKKFRRIIKFSLTGKLNVFVLEFQNYKIIEGKKQEKFLPENNCCVRAGANKK